MVFSRNLIWLFNSGKKVTGNEERKNPATLAPPENPKLQENESHICGPKKRDDLTRILESPVAGMLRFYQEAIVKEEKT